MSMDAYRRIGGSSASSADKVRVMTPMVAATLPKVKSGSGPAARAHAQARALASSSASVGQAGSGTSLIESGVPPVARGQRGRTSPKVESESSAVTTDSSDSSEFSSGELGLVSCLSANARPWHPSTGSSAEYTATPRSDAVRSRTLERLVAESRASRSRKVLRVWHDDCVRRSFRRAEVVARNRARVSICLHHWMALVGSQRCLDQRAKSLRVNGVFREWRQLAAQSHEMTCVFRE